MQSSPTGLLHFYVFWNPKLNRELPLESWVWGRSNIWYLFPRNNGENSRFSISTGAVLSNKKLVSKGSLRKGLQWHIPDASWFYRIFIGFFKLQHQFLHASCAMPRPLRSIQQVGPLSPMISVGALQKNTRYFGVEKILQRYLLIVGGPHNSIDIGSGPIDPVIIWSLWAKDNFRASVNRGENQFWFPECAHGSSDGMGDIFYFFPSMKGREVIFLGVSKHSGDELTDSWDDYWTEHMMSWKASRGCEGQRDPWKPANQGPNAGRNRYSIREQSQQLLFWNSFFFSCVCRLFGGSFLLLLW